MLQRKRCVPFRRAAYVGGGIKMRPCAGLGDIQTSDMCPFMSDLMAHGQGVDKAGQVNQGLVQTRPQVGVE